ncbi:hypothetical protein AB0M95_26015 [Sphaerisporangium sp. NPDC051017]
MEQADFTLNVRVVAAGPATALVDTEECTSDNCTDTPGSAGIANC